MTESLIAAAPKAPGKRSRTPAARPAARPVSGLALAGGPAEHSRVWWTVRQVADFAQVSHTTVYSMIRDGSLPARRTARGKTRASYRIHERDVRERLLVPA